MSCNTFSLYSHVTIAGDEDYDSPTTYRTHLQDAAPKVDRRSSACIFDRGYLHQRRRTTDAHGPQPTAGPVVPGDPHHVLPARQVASSSYSNQDQIPCEGSSHKDSNSKECNTSKETSHNKDDCSSEEGITGEKGEGQQVGKQGVDYGLH